MSLMDNIKYQFQLEIWIDFQVLRQPIYFLDKK